MPRRSAYRETAFDNPLAIELPAKLHPLVVAWMQQDRREEEEARRANHKSIPRENTYLGRRRLRISDALFKATEAKGYGLEYPPGKVGPVSLKIKDRSVEWSLEAAGGMYMPRTLKLIATTGRHDRTTRISERITKPFERRIDEILRRFEKLVDDTIDAEVRSVQYEREFEQAVKAKEKPRRLRVMEKARWNRLREQAADWQEAASLYKFIDAVEQAIGKGAPSGREAAWLDWARWRADQLDPISDGAASAHAIAYWRYSPKPSEYELNDWELTLM